MAAPTTAARVKKTLANPEPSTHVQVFGRRQDVLSTRSCGRRPKSAKARNRGGWGTRRGSERYGGLGGAGRPPALFWNRAGECVLGKKITGPPDPPPNPQPPPPPPGAPHNPKAH